MGVFGRTSRPAATSKKVSFCHIKEQVGRFRRQHMRAELPGGKNLEEEWRLLAWGVKAREHTICRDSKHKQKSYSSCQQLISLRWSDSCDPVLFIMRLYDSNSSLLFWVILEIHRLHSCAGALLVNTIIIIIMFVKTQISSKPLTYKEVCLCVSKPNTKHTYACIFWPLP